MEMYNGSRNESLAFYPAICFTCDESSAASYGDYVHAVEIDRAKLSILSIEMDDDQMRAAIDNQEWPCDRQRDIDAAIAAGYDAVEYTDCDASGRTHSCIRVLTAAAYSAAVA